MELGNQTANVFSPCQNLALWKQDKFFSLKVIALYMVKKSASYQ